MYDILRYTYTFPLEMHEMMKWCARDEEAHLETSRRLGYRRKIQTMSSPGYLRETSIYLVALWWYMQEECTGERTARVEEVDQKHGCVTNAAWLIRIRSGYIVTSWASNNLGQPECAAISETWRWRRDDLWYLSRLLCYRRLLGVELIAQKGCWEKNETVEIEDTKTEKYYQKLQL